MTNDTTDGFPLDPPGFWWVRIYRAGVKAKQDEQPRTPPEALNDDQKKEWLKGYDL